jgi:hypothetical protein
MLEGVALLISAFSQINNTPFYNQHVIYHTVSFVA